MQNYLRKTISRYNNFKLFSTFKYTKTHEYIKINKDTNYAQVGISKFAAENIGEVVFVEMPKKNDVFQENETFAILETIKAVNDIHMPINGKIVEINNELNQELKDELDEEINSEIINNSPLDEGWLVKIKYDSEDLISRKLMDEKEYNSYLENLK